MRLENQIFEKKKSHNSTASLVFYAKREQFKFILGQYEILHSTDFDPDLTTTEQSTTKMPQRPESNTTAFHGRPEEPLGNDSLYLEHFQARLDGSVDGSHLAIYGVCTVIGIFVAGLLCYFVLPKCNAYSTARCLP